jgi:uncharacterized protein (DUF427 family)
LGDTVAFAWRTMDAFYEEERILGHAADPYHRVDIRRSSRHLVVQQDDQVVADTRSALVLYESGFAPRWYVPRAEAQNAAWSYRAPFEEVRRIADLVSFYAEKVTITIDGDKLERVPGQTVLPHGPDRNLSVDEIGGIELVEPTTAASE